MGWAEANYYRCLNNGNGFKNCIEMGVGFKGKGFMFQSNTKGATRKEGIGKNNGLSSSSSKLTAFAFLFGFMLRQILLQLLAKGRRDVLRGRFEDLGWIY